MGFGQLLNPPTTPLPEHFRSTLCSQFGSWGSPRIPLWGSSSSTTWISLGSSCLFKSKAVTKGLVFEAHVIGHVSTPLWQPCLLWPELLLAEDSELLGLVFFFPFHSPLGWLLWFFTLLLHFFYLTDAVVQAEGEFPVQVGLVLLRLEDILLPPAVIFLQGVADCWSPLHLWGYSLKPLGSLPARTALLCAHTTLPAPLAPPACLVDCRLTVPHSYSKG